MTALCLLAQAVITTLMQDFIDSQNKKNYASALSWLNLEQIRLARIEPLSGRRRDLIA